MPARKRGKEQARRERKLKEMREARIAAEISYDDPLSDFCWQQHEGERNGIYGCLCCPSPLESAVDEILDYKSQLGNDA